MSDEILAGFLVMLYSNNTRMEGHYAPLNKFRFSLHIFVFLDNIPNGSDEIICTRSFLIRHSATQSNHNKLYSLSLPPFLLFPSINCALPPSGHSAKRTNRKIADTLQSKQIWIEQNASNAFFVYMSRTYQINYNKTVCPVIVFSFSLPMAFSFFPNTTQISPTEWIV